jgi:hypothetical protein
MHSNGRLFRVQLFLRANDNDGGSEGWPSRDLPKLLDRPADLDGRPGVEILVQVQASCCGGAYRAFTFFRGVLRTMTVEGTNPFETFSTAGGGQSFHCIQPGLLASYGYSLGSGTRVYEVTRTLYVSRGVRWKRWKESSYRVATNSPHAPLGPAAAVSDCR